MTQKSTRRSKLVTGMLLLRSGSGLGVMRQKMAVIKTVAAAISTKMVRHSTNPSSRAMMNGTESRLKPAAVSWKLIALPQSLRSNVAVNMGMAQGR
jgi:hypothetical protein